MSIKYNKKKGHIKKTPEQRREDHKKNKKLALRKRAMKAAEKAYTAAQHRMS